MGFSEKSKDVVTLYSRHGCHLCEVALDLLNELAAEYDFEIEIHYIDGNSDLEKLYGEQVPVTQINGLHHDYWRIDRERFIACLEKDRQHR